MSVKHHLHCGIQQEAVERVCDEHAKKGWHVVAMTLTQSYTYQILFARPLDGPNGNGHWATTEDGRR